MNPRNILLLEQNGNDPSRLSCEHVGLHVAKWFTYGGDICVRRHCFFRASFSFIGLSLVEAFNNYNRKYTPQIVAKVDDLLVYHGSN